jgi:histidinol-phosphate phosphatase family protein
VVVPTTGRRSLFPLLDAVVASRRAPGRILVVDDRRRANGPLAVPDGVEVLATGGRGPAAARNAGWRAATAEWVAFLDDDVVPGPAWAERLAADLGGVAGDVAGSQARLQVPLPAGRRPTDWERRVAALESSRWITADMAYRRSVLAQVGGFDERFPRAYREDADLGLRVVRAGYRIVAGSRLTTHPVGPARRWASLRDQAGNRDDVLMYRLHGRRWREACGAPPGRWRRHAAITAAGLAGLAGAVAGRRAVAVAGAAGWVAGTAELAWSRIAPGPRTGGEVLTMVATSAVLPAVATWHRIAGVATLRRRLRSGLPPASRPAAVLLDRDGTLVHDVPYNTDPDRVAPVAGAREALDRLRAAGVPLAVVSNQSGMARGVVTPDELEAVNRRVEELLGPIGPWVVCPHGPDDGCACRKPAPGLVLQAARALGVDPSRCAVVGDIGADVEAASAAGARGVLVPTAATRPEEVAAAPEVAPDLAAAVDLLLGPRP